MYCPNCGTQNSDKSKFCKECGYDIAARLNKASNTNVSSTSNTTDASTKKTSSEGIGILLKFLGIVFTIPFIIFAIVVILIFVFMFKFMAQGRKETIDFNNISVPTIYKVTGHSRKVCGYGSNSSNEYQRYYYSYCTEYSIEDINEYTNYLITEEGFNKDSENDNNLYKKAGKYTIIVTPSTEKTEYVFEIKDDINEESE